MLLGLPYRISTASRLFAAALVCIWMYTSYVLLSKKATPDDNPSNEKRDVPLNVPLRGGDTNEDDTIHVCFTSDRNTVIGAMAAINSVRQNTQHKVQFHVFVEKEIVEEVRRWLQRSVLHDVDARVIGFDGALLQDKIKVRGGRTELAKPMNYVRFLYPILLPLIQGRIIHLDDDVIVQGDIKELADIPFKPGQLAAFSDDCTSLSKRFSRIENKYINFLNFQSEHIKRLHLNPAACSFNTGIFVTDLGLWSTYNITNHLIYWMELNTRENIYGNQKGGGGSQPPMMIVFYDKYTNIDPLWHVRYLGSTSGSHYSQSIITRAKLLHWNGRQKPWAGLSQYQSIWNRYYVPDPAGKFRPVRRKRRPTGVKSRRPG